MEGQTTKIAERIAEVLRKKGNQVVTQSADHLPADFRIESYDATIIGGSIHMSHYPKYLKKFIQQHHDWLNDHPTALFTVCMAINSKLPESRQQAENFGKKLTEDTAWQPAFMTTFAGAVKYTQYGFFTRFIMKMISRHEGGNTDTSKDHEYTNWEAVARFAEQFSENLSGLAATDQ
jgi:menaquinone-dependent protoporphyrinogen oxidase